MTGVAPPDEDLSKYIFGSSHVLSILVEIGRSPSGEFSAPQLIAATGLSQSTVHSLVTRLKRAGLVRRTGEVSAERVAIYERSNHPIWEFAQYVKDEADAADAADRRWDRSRAAS